MKQGCGNAVGKIYSNYRIYAITITPSPYRAFKRDNSNENSFQRYKDMSNSYQRQVIAKLLFDYLELDEVYYLHPHYELTKEGRIHLHMAIKCTEGSIKQFINYVVNYVGYNGRNNKNEDFIKVKELLNKNDQVLWEHYCRKDENNDYNYLSTVRGEALFGSGADK